VKCFLDIYCRSNIFTMRKLNIKSKLVVITGSAGGLGKAFAVKLLSLGASVCISDINENLGRQTLSELSETFGEDRVEFVGCDVTKEDSVEKLIKQAEEVFKSKLYCFINNAGVMGEKEGWRLCMDINLTGVLHGTNLAMDQMGKDKGGNGGVVVNVASILGLFCAEQPKGYEFNVINQKSFWFYFMLQAISTMSARVQLSL